MDRRKNLFSQCAMRHLDGYFSDRLRQAKLDVASLLLRFAFLASRKNISPICHISTAKTGSEFYAWLLVAFALILLAFKA